MLTERELNVFRRLDEKTQRRLIKEGKASQEDMVGGRRC
jgi:hypothetical protein